MTFRRLLRADVIVMVAALVLLLVMALDWYSTIAGESAREYERLVEPDDDVASQSQQENAEDARFVAESQERNAWQADGTIDRLILVGLLATVILALAAGFLRAAARRYDPPATPSAAVAVMATLTGLALAYRTIQEPGEDATNTVETGAPLGLAVLGVIALAAVAAMRAEESGRAWEEPRPQGDGGEGRLESPAG